MLDRLLGLETEYAIRFTPAPDFSGEPPSKSFVYGALLEGVKEQVATRPGRVLRDEVFTINGGGFRYEYGPLGAGLIEGGTPECRGPSAALLYQRAQDRLLAGSVDSASDLLEASGYPGDLGLLKNCRDAAGNIYGAQENYDVVIAEGASLLGWRAGIALLTGPALLVSAAMWALFAILVLVVVLLWLGLGGAAFLIRPLRRTAVYQRMNRADVQFPLERPFERSLNAISIAAMLPFALALRGLVAMFGFRKLRRWLEPFLVSRPIISGAGTIAADGSFQLSEKALGIYCRVGATSTGRDRGIVDVGNLVKPLVSLILGDWRGYVGLYRRRQRLQLGLSDSNMAEVAEYLKIATTALVIDMASSDVDEGDLPRLRHPLETLAAINRDLDLEQALAIQRRYLELASRYVARCPTPSLEAVELVKRWRSVLHDLGANRSALFGQIDWVTKKALLDRAAGESDDVRKKIDLKYHELGTGYFAELERRNLVRPLVDSDDVDRAITEPPAGSPAVQRSELICGHGDIRVSWDKVRVGGRLGNTFGGQVIELDRYRD